MPLTIQSDEEPGDFMHSITTVIPAYNSESTIEKAILSVLNQIEPPEEVIVVDDGSTDNTTSVVEKFGGNVVLIRQKNQGSAVARQTGSTVATSTYIAYLDSDDWWPEKKIARFREIISKTDVNFMLTDLQRARLGDGLEEYLPRNRTFFPWTKEFFSNKNYEPGIENLYKLSPDSGLSLLLHGFPVYPSTALVKRSVLESVGGWDSRFLRCQDFDIGLRIARNSPLHYLDEVQAILGLHSGNDDAYAYVVKQTEGDINVLLAHLHSEPLDSPYYHQVTMSLARKYCNLAYNHRKTGEKKLAKDNYLLSIKYPGKRFHAFMRWSAMFI